MEKGAKQAGAEELQYVLQVPAAFLRMRTDAQCRSATGSEIADAASLCREVALVDVERSQSRGQASQSAAANQENTNHILGTFAPESTSSTNTDVLVRLLRENNCVDEATRLETHPSALTVADVLKAGIAALSRNQGSTSTIVQNQLICHSESIQASSVSEETVGTGLVNLHVI
jgi:hypothetical protein